MSDQEVARLDRAVAEWRQGDIVLGQGITFYHLADICNPCTPASHELAQARAMSGESCVLEMAAEDVVGWVILTQTCDVVRSCKFRPYIEVAPLVRVSEEILYGARRKRRFNFAYIPAAAPLGLAADLSRTMTVEKAVIAGLPRTPGWTKDKEIVEIADAFARKWRRFAFPDDFNVAVRDLLQHINRRHNRRSRVGFHLRALAEIRVMASPSWDSDRVSLRLLFIISDEPADTDFDWPTFVGECNGMIDTSGRFTTREAVARKLDDLTAREYSLSQHLELDHLSYEGDR